MTRYVMPLLLLACAPQTIKMRPEAEDTGGEGEGEGDDSTPDSDSGSSEEAGPFPDACDAAGVDDGTCCMLIRYEYIETTVITIVAVDADVGGDGVVIAELNVGGVPAQQVLENFSSFMISSLARDGATAYACGHQTPQYAVDLSTGEVSTGPALACGSFTAWRGDDSYPPGVIMMDSDQGLHYYSEYGSMFSNTGGTDLGWVSPALVNMATLDDTLFGLAANDKDATLLHMPDMADLGTLTLEDFNTWIWGVSMVGDVLYVLDDGRGTDERTAARLLSFDATTGEQLGFTYLGITAEWDGLYCEAR